VTAGSPWAPSLGRWFSRHRHVPDIPAPEVGQPRSQWVVGSFRCIWQDWAEQAAAKLLADGQCRAALLHLQARPIRVIHWFAGAGLVRCTIERLTEALRSRGVHINWHWVADVEKDKHCQKILQMLFPGTPLVEDAQQMHGGNIDSLSADVSLGGVVCSSMSPLNIHRSRNRGCLLNRKGGTGLTYGLLHDYLLAERSPLVIVENTPTFGSAVDVVHEEAESPMDVFSAEFTAMEYSGIAKDLNAALLDPSCLACTPKYGH